MIALPPAIENPVPKDGNGVLEIFRALCLEGKASFHAGEIQEISQDALPALVKNALKRAAPARKVPAADVVADGKYYRLVVRNRNDYLTIEDRKLGSEPSRRECSVIGAGINPEEAVITLSDPPPSGSKPRPSSKGRLSDWFLNSSRGYQLRVLPLDYGWTLIRSEVDAAPENAETPWGVEMKKWYSQTSK